ncbi:hypothetical protein D3C85_1301090 [compost metagenome]
MLEAGVMFEEGLQDTALPCPIAAGDCDIEHFLVVQRMQEFTLIPCNPVVLHQYRSQRLEIESILTTPGCERSPCCPATGDNRPPTAAGAAHNYP